LISVSNEFLNRRQDGDRRREHRTHLDRDF
jgi:hypothetical protein